MDTSNIKLELFRIIDKLDDNRLTEIYDYINKIGSRKDHDFWNDLSEEEKADIEAGIKDLNDDKKKDFNEVIKSYM